MTDLPTDLPAGFDDTFARWLARVPRGGRTVVLGHFDADGLAAAALFGRGLPRLGLGDVVAVSSGRTESAFSDEARDRLRAMAPDALVVTDLGVSEAGTLEADVGPLGGPIPVLYVDHHRPTGEPAGADVVSGYGLDPTPCSAWLAFGLLQHAVAGVEGDDPTLGVHDLDWIAAVGVLSDLGDKAPWPPLADAKRRHTATWLKEATVLVNAARRGVTFRADAALKLLMETDSPRELAEAPEADALRAARAEVAAAMAEARKKAPAFSADQPFALVTIDSPCQIHPLIAQQWRTRLPRHAVLCANTGYLPGMVAFSTRTARTDLVLPEIYGAIETGAWNGRWGHGHDQASGGHLPPDVFDTVLDALGFPPGAHVSDGG